jgi:hypothetical protein
VTPDPPKTIGPIRLFRLKKGALLHRILRVGVSENSFNPCKGRPTRFAPIYDENGTCIPSLYAGQNFDCAVFETIFRDIPVGSKTKFVRIKELEDRAYGILKTDRPFKLAALFAPELKALGLKRTQLIDTTAYWYTKTAQWAKAIHDQYKDIEGLVWTSRQSDPEMAYLLFGDRVLIDDLLVDSDAIELMESVEVMSDIRTLGIRAQVTIVR